MEYRSCPGSELSLPVLGIGCWSFGGGKYWGIQDQADVTEVVHMAADHGASYFDTAEVYNEGRSEEALGRALKEIPRDRVIIGSKISPSNCQPEVLIRHCEASLKRLQTDYMDLYMIHWPIHAHSIRHFTDDEKLIQDPPALDDAFEALLKLKRSGKIRHIGVSNFSRGRLDELPNKAAINELPYNLLSRAIEFDAMDHCRDQGIGIIAYNALMQGFLSGRYAGGEDLPHMRRRTRHFDSRENPLCRHGEHGFEEALNLDMNKIRDLCSSSGYSMAELSLGWVMSHKEIHCTLAGSRNSEQLMANLACLEKPVPEELISALERATRRLRDLMGNHIDYFENARLDRSL